jgi:hypothetical protein
MTLSLNTKLRKIIRRLILTKRYNTQIIVINILFNFDIPQSPFTIYGIDDSMTGSDKNYTTEQCITLIKTEISNLKKEYIKMTENHQALMDILGKHVTQH